MEVTKGLVVLSKAGRDKGKFLAVVGCDGRFCSLADGKERPLERPKRKELRHIASTGTVLQPGSMETNRQLRRALAGLQNSGQENP